MSAAAGSLRVRFGDYELDEANARLVRAGVALPIAPKPFALLCALVRNAGSLLTKNQLLDQVWGHQFVSDSVLKTAISDLRTALADDPRQPRYIETASRRGYRFVAAVYPAGGGTTPLTSVARDASGALPFVGRQQELARLHAAWDAACAGRTEIVFVTGEAGIGKTALIEQFVARLGDVPCVRGQCVDQYGAGEPYHPVLEAIAELCRIDASHGDMLRTAAPAWLLQMPWLCSAEERDRLQRELAGAGPDRMLREAGELLARGAERQPLLLITEDLHWSDRATVQLVDYVARRRGKSRLMWLASFRLAEVVAGDHPLSALRHELRLHGLCQEIVLDPFSETEVAACVAARSPALAVDEAFVRALHRRTDGVPLFVTSVVSDVMNRAPEELASPSRATGLVQMAVPENLAGIIDRFIARLDPQQRELLTAGSVLGSELRVTTLARVLGRDAADVEQTCELLAREQRWLRTCGVRRGVDDFEDGYAFSHAIFRQVLYDRTAPFARAMLHARVGEALLRDRADGLDVASGELAIHFERGREPLKALRHYADASQTALQHAVPDECFALTGRALSLLNSVPADATRDSLEITLATLRGVAGFQIRGVGEETKAAFSRAHARLGAVPEHPMRGLVLHGFGWILSLRAEYDAALELSRQAEALATTTDDAVLRLAAATVQGTVHMLQGRYRLAQACVDRVSVTVGALDELPGHYFVADPMVTLVALHGLLLLHLGQVVQGRCRIEQAQARAASVEQPVAQMVALWYRALFEVRLGDAAVVRRVAGEMERIVEQYALAQGWAASHWFLGWAEARLGSSRESLAHLDAARAEDRHLGLASATSENFGYAAEASLLAGDLSAAQASLDEALAAARVHGERLYLPQLGLIQSAIHRSLGRRSEEEASIRQALNEAQAQEAAWLELQCLVALCEHDLAADADRRSLRELLGRFPETAGTGLASRAQTLLDR